MSENLEPCPFCGSRVNMTYNSYANKFIVWHMDVVECWIDEPITLPCGLGCSSLSEAAKALMFTTTI